MKHFFFSQMLFLFLVCACTRNNPPGVKNALKLAGENRQELEKVLEHYSQNPKDSLKYQAACFLIENMPVYGSYEGELLDNYLPIYQELATSGKNPQAVLDSFVQRYGYFSFQRVKWKPDIREINAAYLINNIEWAFKVWEEQPWGKNVLFDDFCEYNYPQILDNNNN